MEEGVYIGDINIPALVGKEGKIGPAGKIVEVKIIELKVTESPYIKNTGTESEAILEIGIPKANSIKDTNLDDSGNLKLILENDKEILVGPVKGLGIDNIKIENGQLVITMSDESTFNVGNIIGPKGDSFKFEDFTEEQLELLKGPKGETGNPGRDGIDGENGLDGVDGIDGATFIPNIDENGDLSWSNDKNLENPTTVNIKGPKGNTGEKGNTGNGIQKFELTSGTHKAGELDTYLITFTDGTDKEIQIYNGKDGKDGKDGEGSGDMSKDVYDTDDDGIVDNAKKVDGHTVESNVPQNAKFTDTTYENATSMQAGLMSEGDKSKLDGIDRNANNYTHPTGDGNNHIPTGGTVGQILVNNGSGSVEWADNEGKTYEKATDLEDGLMSKEDFTKLQNIEENAQENKIEKIKVNGTEQDISTKEVDIDVDSILEGKGYQTLQEVESIITKKGYKTETEIQKLITTALSNCIPIGAGFDYHGGEAPKNYMFADGRALNKTEYAELYAVIGDSYRKSDNSNYNTFNIPDKRERVSVMYSSTSDTFNLIGKMVGEKKHTMTTEELAKHSHDVKDVDKNKILGSHGSLQSNVSWGVTISSTAGRNTTWKAVDTGSSQPFNIIQPSLVCNYIIKVK